MKLIYANLNQYKLVISSASFGTTPEVWSAVRIEFSNNFLLARVRRYYYYIQTKYRSGIKLQVLNTE